MNVRGKTAKYVPSVLRKLGISEAQSRAPLRRLTDAALAIAHSYAPWAPPLVQQVLLLLRRCLPSIFHECLNAPDISFVFTGAPY